MKIIKECIECKEEKVHYAKGMCKECYRSFSYFKRKESFYDKCRCGNVKFESSKQCRECYIKGTKGGLSKSMKFDKEKGEWIGRKE